MPVRLGYESVCVEKCVLDEVLERFIGQALAVIHGASPKMPSSMSGLGRLDGARIGAVLAKAFQS